MKYDIEKISCNIDKLFDKILLEEKKECLKRTKDEFKKKELIIEDYFKSNDYKLGKKALNFNSELKNIKSEFNLLYENFNDKLMLFIIGVGNVGKSTLINALIGMGKEEAKVSDIPATWNIDIYHPENGDNKAEIVYKDGKKTVLTRNEAVELIKEEEKKIEESKKIFNKRKNEELRKLKTKDEREEMQKKLSDELLYISDISEVHKSVKSSSLLKQCLLVDTPGLNQNRIGAEQIGSINDYYHKADGVLWMIDSSTINGASTEATLNNLNKTLDEVGGIRDNIIGVINKIDKIQGDERREAVIQEAEKIFGNTFVDIVPISAEKAFSSTKNNDKKLLEESNIERLQRAIQDIFISRAEKIKNSAKEQGARSLLKHTDNLINNHKNELIDLKACYDKKIHYYNNEKKKIKDNLKREFDNMFSKYLDEVSGRVKIYIDSLAEGEGKEFIKETIYNINDLTDRINTIIKIEENEIKRLKDMWLKEAYVSEYKYINYIVNYEYIKMDVKSNFDFSGLNNIEIFIPSQEDDIFSFIGNLFGKVKFLFKKSGIIEKLNSTIKNQCNMVNNKILTEFEGIINKIIHESIENLDNSFEKLALDVNKLDVYIEEMEELYKNIYKENSDISLFDIL